MRASITIEIGSATSTEAQQLIFAFQRLRNRVGQEALPVQINNEPTVRCMGIGWHVKLPPVRLGQASELMRDFDQNVLSLSPEASNG